MFSLANPKDLNWKDDQKTLKNYREKLYKKWKSRPNLTPYFDDYSQERSKAEQLNLKYICLAMSAIPKRIQKTMWELWLVAALRTKISCSLIM